MGNWTRDFTRHFNRDSRLSRCAIFRRRNSAHGGGLDSNEQVVDVGTMRFTWSERFSVKPVVLTVNTDIQFYREKEWFVVVDAKGKQHRFTLVGKEQLLPKN